MARAYDNARRAQVAAETGERIAAATEALLQEGPIAAVTLRSVSDRAGVTVQTVLRHTGSREGCIEAAARRISERIDAQRGQPTPGNVAAAIDRLLEHYETDGRLVLNLLSQERADARAAAAVAEGRARHRAWVAGVFDPRLAEGHGDDTLDALVAATDLYVWKLLRLDLGRSLEASRRVINRLVEAILESQCPPS